MDMKDELREAYVDEEEHDANEGALWNADRVLCQRTGIRRRGLYGAALRFQSQATGSFRLVGRVRDYGAVLCLDGEPVPLFSDLRPDRPDELVRKG